MRSSINPNTLKRKSITPKIINDIITESEYINTIISHNILENFNISFFSFKKIFPRSKSNLFCFLRRMKFIWASKKSYKKLNKDSYLNLLLNLGLNVLEYKNDNQEIRVNLLKNYALLLNKMFLNEKIKLSDISIIIKFLAYSSIYKRKEINKDNIHLLKKLAGSQIKYYENIKLIIEIIKKLNIAMITLEFCEFLNAQFLVNKTNILILTENTDFLELLYLNDQNAFVLDFLSKIYSFRSDERFLELFIEKIKNIYKERRNKNITKENEVEMNNSLTNLLYNLNRSILFIQSLKQNEENKNKEDSFFPEKGFLFNNLKHNGLYVEKIIVQHCLTIVFSFCFSPKDKNTHDNDIEYPIFIAFSDKGQNEAIYFYIKNDMFYYKQVKSNRLYPICEVKKNQTYLVYYSIKEHDSFVLKIRSDNFEPEEIKESYKQLLRKNLTMYIGRYNKHNFEGYIGPILIFKEELDDEIKNFIFLLKGYYDKILYFHEFNTLESDKYDKYINYILNDGNYNNYIQENKNENTNDKKPKKLFDKKNKNNKSNETTNVIKMNNRDYFIKMQKRLKESDELNKNLLSYISPLFGNSVKKKREFTNNIFIETIIKKLTEHSTTVFYKNKSFIFQFLKYDGFHYLIMILELVITNYENIKTDTHKKNIIHIFQCILIFMTGILSHINIEFYLDEIRLLLFCIKKFIIKFSKFEGVGNEIHIILNNNLQNLKTLNENNFTENKKHYINVIRNEICKILLNVELYDLNNFSLINKFMTNLYNFIENSDTQTGLINLKLFKKIIDFAKILEKIDVKNNKIKHDTAFKLFRNQFSKIVVDFVKKSECLEIYTELFNIFSNDLKFNYLKYQSIKYFYLLSQYYFNTVDNVVLMKSWKYFIDLYEYFEKNSNIAHRENDSDINQKEEYIIMSISLRIILETTIYKDFFKSNLKKNEENNEPMEETLLLLKTKEEGIKKNIEGSLIYKLISSGYWTATKNYISYNKSKNSDKDKNKNKYKKKHFRSKSIEKNENNTKLNLNYEDNLLTDIDNGPYERGIKRINSVWVKNIYKNNDPQTSKNLLNYSLLQNSSINNSSIIDVENDNKKKKKNKYEIYYSYHSLFGKLSKSGTLNDYCFKAMILFILEKNNKVIIPQNVKLNFILKVKKYEDLENPDYKSFLCIKYYNKEIKTEFRLFIKIIETNKNRLSNICYDILLYILIKIIKEREKCRNIFTEFIESKKICNKFIKYSFLYNKQSADIILKEFPLFIKLVLPFQRKVFIPYLLYDSILDTYIHDNYAEKLFNIFLNTKSELANNNRNYYDFYVNKMLILYHVFNTHKVFIDDKIDLDEKGLLDLYQENLVFIKYDILFTHKNKCYVELLFSFFMNLFLKSKNKRYISIMDKIFIEEAEKMKKEVKGSKTLLFYIDKMNIKDDKKNPCVKYYNKSNKIESSLCILLLFRTLKLWWEYRNEKNDIKQELQKYISYLFEDSKLIYKENKIYQKKNKNNEWYNYILDNLSEIINNKKEIKIEDIQQKLINKYNTDANKKVDKEDKKNKIFTDSMASNDSINLSVTNNSDLDFSKMADISLSDNELEKDNDNKNKIENKNEKNQNRNSINNNDILSPNDSLLKLRKVILSKTQYNAIIDKSKNIKSNYKDDYLDIENINNRGRVIIFPKNTLIEQRYSIYFTDILFYNKLFVLMKNYYKYYVKKETNHDIDISNFFNFPTIIRNYTPLKIFFGEFFLKNDLNFFDNKLLEVSHPYFLEKLKQFKIKNINIFPKKTEQDDIYNLLIEKQIDEDNCFCVDLITNRNVIFGQLIVTKNMIYFENISKEEFLKNKTDSAKEKWLLCSLDCDYSKRVKKIYIFKNEISEIINRRFLYLFQACELFLKNGKSYCFNFYSEIKKIQFFSLFKNNSSIDIIYDLKSNFKKKNYTKQWLTNDLSTLEYLLLLNKFSSRSYNDINQYPVFPWLELYNDKVRDLKFTIAAQTEEDRMIKKEMYLASNDKFPYHYTTHFSNSSYLSYYLVRTNPFTYNQINLQVNKFDNPQRQFNAVDEILKILDHSKQPREVIPEFFLSTEFYYNYNCNFYGVTDDGHLVNNLYNKKGYDSPLEYILHNALMLETPQVKNEINYFFDSIYGTGQMGGADGYNTYNKYSYQEMFDLREKIDKYKRQKLNYSKIKEKIISKANKIISFGQTPFKLLEDKHPQWVENSQNNSNIINTNNNSLNNANTIVERTSLKPGNALMVDEDNILRGTQFHANFLYFDIYPNKNTHSKQCIYMLNKLTKHYELKFYDTNFRENSSVKNIVIPKKIKLFSKLKIFNSKFLQAYKYNPKNIMINIKLSIFIFTHFNDNSFKIFSSKGEKYSIMTESMVTCITKICDNMFFTGHFNGKIILWKLPIYEKEKEKEVSINDFSSIKVVYNFIGHKKRVNSIVYSEKLEIIISCGDDKKIYIRKYYDLSLLSMIDINNKICIDIKVEHYYIYLLLFDEIKQKYIIEIYSLNGILVGKSDYDYINNFNFDKDGNLLIGYYKKNYIDIYEPSLMKKIGEYIIIDEESKILNGDKKILQLNEKISIGDDTLVTNFYYNKCDNSVYFSLSNGYLFCKRLSH